MSPVDGGAASARITRDPIDVAAITAAVTSPAHGAVVVFLGTVREQNEGRPVAGMRYDAYAAMAEEVLSGIVQQAGALSAGGRVAAVHRIGDLAIGDVSVAVAAASAHRAPAFEAARYVIETIKQRLPVWKQEHYTNGDDAWLDGVVPQAHD